MGSQLEANSTNVRKRIENHTFDDEEGEEYEASTFGGFSDYMRRKKLKLQNLDAELRSQSTQNPPIFRGVVAHVNGYTQPSLSDLHTLIVSYGGGFLQYLDGKTVATHVIASNLTPKKKVEFARYRIVKPAWVVDSVKAGKLLPWDAYRVVDEGVKQKVLGFDNGRIVSQANAQQSGYREQTESSWYTSQIRKDADGLITPAVAGESIGVEPQLAMTGSNEEAPLASSSETSPTGDALTPVPTSSIQKDLSFLADEIEPENDALRNDHGTISDAVGSLTQPRNLSGTVQDNILCEADSSSGQSRQTSSESDRHNGGSGMTAMQQFTNESSVTEPFQTSEPRPSPQLSKNASPEKSKFTAEEHNARLLSDPHLAKSSTANPDFLNQYYRESRLHHLSTWKADLKAQLQSLANEQTSSQKARQKRPPGARRYVMHVDFDSFFAAVSLRKHSDLVDKPVVIAHGSGPGSEIASCNYPARKFGVKNGMWMRSALQLCPDLKTLPYDYKAYEEASRHFYEAIIATDGIIQSVSIDEALVDITNQCITGGGSDGMGISEGSIYREQAKADEIATNLRILIKEKTGCEVSVGIGNNILLAKVALRKAKPAGQHQIKPEEVLDFIGELTVQDLPGVAYSLGGKLEEIGVKYVKDIRNLTKERLVGVLGPKTGERLWDYSRGIDKTEVGEQVVRKSVSAEVNWGVRFVTQQQADEFVQCLCDELSRRLLEQGFKGKQLTMKIMRRAADAPLDPPKNLGHGKCDTFNKSVVLRVATNDKVVLGKEALSILKGYGFTPGELRGLGVQMQKLEPLKPSTKSVLPTAESSQRRLQFKQPSSMPSPHAQISTPSECSRSSAPPTLLKKPPKVQDHPDPIERSPTPEGNIGVEPIKGALSTSHSGPSDATHKPLNITGTQFVLPTQIDPSVLAELPSDIRSKLAPKQKRIIDTLTTHRSPSPPRSRSASPFPYASDLPNQSQVDPEILAALPEDVKNELLSFYQSEASKSRSRQQQLLPQSPRKPRPALPSKKLSLTPNKKQKTSSTLHSRGRPSKSTIKSSTSTSTLTQSNFLTNSVSKKHPPPPPSKTSDDLPFSTNLTADPPPQLQDPDQDQGQGPKISASFLSALPPDLRAEILSEQKRNRLRQRSGLDISSSTKRKPHRPPPPQPPSDLTEGAGGGQRKLILAPSSLSSSKEEMPTFTSRKLCRIEELREAMREWVEEFSGPVGFTEEGRRGVEAGGGKGQGEGEGEGEGEEESSGPYNEDVEALATYLGKVVTVERNMEKAVSVVQWVGWLVGEFEGRRRRSPWLRVLDRLKEVVREAVTSRGLGEVDFA